MSVQAVLRGEETPVVYVLRDDDDFTGRRQSAPGIPVHKIRPMQNLPLLHAAFHAAGERDLTDHTVLNLAREHFGPITRAEVKAETSRMKVKEIKFRETPKGEGRLNEKEADPSFGGPAGHTDIDACMLFPKTVHAFTAATDHHLPAENRSVARLIINASNPDARTKYPANLANVITMGTIGGITVPWVHERQIGMDGWQPYYDLTHGQMNVQRGIGQVYNRASGGIDPGIQRRLGRMQRAAEKTVPEINEEMAVRTGLDKLRQKREYYKVDDIAFTVARDGTGAEFCFYADPKTGFYRTENSLRSTMNSAAVISREEFYLHSLTTVPKPDLSKTGVMPDGMPQRGWQPRVVHG